MKDRSSLEAVYEGLDAAEAACRPEWAALLAAARPPHGQAGTRRTPGQERRARGDLRAKSAELTRKAERRDLLAKLEHELLESPKRRVGLPRRRANRR